LETAAADLRIVRIILTALVAAVSVSAQTQCISDLQGNQVCVGTQKNHHVCGCNDFGADCPAWPFYCDDVVVQKSAPEGTQLYSKVLGGESEQRPAQFLFDSQNDLILLGATYSKDFPTTSNAVQPVYAGPIPSYNETGLPPPPGGDLFLSILIPTGDLVYSTFLGSSEDDRVIGIRASPGDQVDVLANAGSGDFPVVPAATRNPTGGAVVFTFDASLRVLAHSVYLPANGTAAWQPGGGISLVNASALYSFDRNGQPLAFASLASYNFRGTPSVATDPAGDVWLTGNAINGQTIVAKLYGGTTEAFRWTLPVATGSGYLTAPAFGPDGLAYVRGGGKDLAVTPNALLRVPCGSTLAAIVAVLDAQGSVRMLTYLPSSPISISFDPSGVASVTLDDPYGTRAPISLTPRPTALCTEDALDRPVATYWGIGQLVRLRGGNFGPQSPALATPGPDQHYPTALGTVQVSVNGVAAPIISTGFGEAIFQMPFETPEGNNVPITVIDGSLQSAPLPACTRRLWPQIAGQVLNADKTRNSSENPAAWGSIISVSFTGGGSYNPPLDDGRSHPLSRCAIWQNPSAYRS